MEFDTVSIITIDKKRYEDQYDFEDAVSNIIFTLMKNGYIMTVKEEDKDLVVIEYDYQDACFGGRYPCWLDEDEMCSIGNREEND